MNYGGRAEIADAAAAMAADAVAGRLRPDKMDNEVLARYLDEPSLPDVDLFIRSSGERRLSNFLIWQSAYADSYSWTRCFPTSTGGTSGKRGRSTPAGTAGTEGRCPIPCRYLVAWMIATTGTARRPQPRAVAARDGPPWATTAPPASRETRRRGSARRRPATRAPPARQPVARPRPPGEATPAAGAATPVPSRLTAQSGGVTRSRPGCRASHRAATAGPCPAAASPARGLPAAKSRRSSFQPVPLAVSGSQFPSNIRAARTSPARGARFSCHDADARRASVLSAAST